MLLDVSLLNRCGILQDLGERLMEHPDVIAIDPRSAP
jgi:hypothetical protein